MKRSLLAVLCLALSTVCIASRLVAAPHFGTPWQLKQPDGTLVDVRIWGDEYYQVVETPDGYTLMRDPVTSEIVYAQLSADGNELVSTGVRVGTRSPVSLGLQTHVRIDPDVAGAQARAMREKAFPELKNMTYGEMMAVPPSTGSPVGLVLLADFSDQVATIPRADVVNYCNQAGYNQNGNNGSIHDYFNDVSNGALNYTCWVSAAYHRASQPFSYYDNCAVDWLDRAVELIVEILNEMEANGFDFSQYDANGDGEIDAINLFYAGNTTCGWALGMWPGSGSFTGWSADGVSAHRFQITGMGNSLRIETFLHENGHMICGWPDLYDYDDAPNVGAGVGGFDIMCNGMSSTNPVEPSAELKRRAGWETVTDLPGAPTAGMLLPVSSGDTCYRWARSATEFFLIENRQKTGRDQFVPDSGLALWHIDTTGNNSNEEMLPGKHYYVTLVQADGDWDLENNNNQGDATDLYAAPDFTAAKGCTDPSTDWWDGTESNLSIMGISTSQTTMTFDFSPESHIPQLILKQFSADADEDCCVLVTLDDIVDTASDLDGPGDIASLGITEVDGVNKPSLEEIEICGDGEHVVEVTITDTCGAMVISYTTVEVLNDAPVALVQDFEANANDACCITVHVEDIDAGSYDPDGEGDIQSLCITDLDGEDVTCADSVIVCGRGFHTVDLTITDWCDSTSTATATIEVIDNTPPDITVVLDRNALWPPNHKMVEICADITVTDNCDADPDVALASIACDEPENGKGDGDTVSDIVLGSSYECFELRAERMGGEDGRTYTIVYTATDDAGNVGYSTTHVDVPHDKSAVAITSSGFNGDGTTLVQSATRFALFIPGSESLPVRSIDTKNIYVGNTAGVIRAGETRLVDINNDQKADLAAMFEATPQDVNALLESYGVIPAGDGAIDVTVVNDGTVGLHFTMQDGAHYLASNIFLLGAPVAMPDISGKKVTTLDGQTIAPVVEPAVAPDAGKVTALTSIRPNPFNPQTTVHFSLATSERVRIAIYDVTGALVRRLVDETMPAGDHQARWDGMTDAGHGATSGVYFVRMIAGSYTEVRKIVMLK